MREAHKIQSGELYVSHVLLYTSGLAAPGSKNDPKLYKAGVTLQCIQQYNGQDRCQYSITAIHERWRRKARLVFGSPPAIPPTHLFSLLSVESPEVLLPPRSFEGAP